MRSSQRELLVLAVLASSAGAQVNQASNGYGYLGCHQISNFNVVFETPSRGRVDGPVECQSLCFGNGQPGQRRLFVAVAPDFNSLPSGYGICYCSFQFDFPNPVFDPVTATSTTSSSSLSSPSSSIGSSSTGTPVLVFKHVNCIAKLLWADLRTDIYASIQLRRLN
ncbi:hypothetical protein CPLU01_15034 [Colletotrichum plurivorum]|uniref:WSC domain-containing protein n=1 Tax=Colletotrichum plurivorum TaxID=2175906 RepID=A0A8H6MWM2_9PEZI|nr:hypothetical protein CPLU01_15034 [Colletotrichum plurivorum]